MPEQDDTGANEAQHCIYIAALLVVFLLHTRIHSIIRTLIPSVLLVCHTRPSEQVYNSCLAMSDELAPPRTSTGMEDPGAKDLVESSDEHFSDASEGRPKRSEATSPIPITRVERVDDAPAHGEVPGTDAYNMRTQDAVPDEVEIVPEGSRSRSTSRVSVSDRPLTPGGTPIPKTIVEKIDPDKPAYGDVPGTQAHQMRLADAEPDVIIKAPQPAQRSSEGLQ